METFTFTFMPCLLLLLASLSLYLIFFNRRNSSSYPKNLPPGSRGWPVLGETLELVLLGFPKLVRRKMQNNSPQVFKTTLFGETMAVICGAKGNKFVFTNDNKLVKPWFPLSLRKVMFPDLDEGRSMEPKTQILHFQYDALKPQALKRYIPVMDALAREHLDGRWRSESPVKVAPWTKKYTLELACRVFMNVVDRDRVGGLLEPLKLLSNGLVSLPVNLPGTDFSRAIKGGRAVRGEVMRIVRERREEMLMKKMQVEVEVEGEGEVDLLSKMVMATDEDGKYLSETMVSHVMLGLLVAGQYEVSSAITIVVKYLAHLPHIYQLVFEEQMKIAKSKGPDEMLAWEDVEKMKYTWNVIRESFRLTPPSHGSFREATAEISFGGFTIPKGWKIMWTSHSSHSNPDYFPEPEKFDPSRFEGSGPAPYTFVPFGGGPRMCPGRNYARIVLLVFIHNLVTRFRLDEVIPNEEMLFHRASPAPAHGLPIHLRPHQK